MIDCVSFLTSLARFSEKWMVNFWIPLFKYFHLSCSSLRSSLLSTYSLFNNKDVLNFWKHYPWENSLILFNEKRIGEWFVAKEAKISVIFTHSCRTFDTKKSHSRKSATFTATSVMGVIIMQHLIKVCNKYLKNWLKD